MRVDSSAKNLKGELELLTRDEKSLTRAILLNSFTYVVDLKKLHFLRTFFFLLLCCKFFLNAVFVYSRIIKENLLHFLCFNVCLT